MFRAVGIKGLLTEKPQFTKGRVADRIRHIRGAIQHLDDQVLDGTVPEGSPFALQATGPETPIPEQPGKR
jgi:hypothetical protein